ncbi:amidohydrolase family protein [Curtobacterium pusillum]|uniref:Amidohydrolase family protein n=1 Tax=Curtobacterium pusillum TaxID=69373 RepID=A0AAW3T8D4_9MICO|nr:amidohydrolase family protein [Curtobacterium pusillum]MBA8991009.1 cytosine/adenosine deaminase-related metal-dependent hydrolase [Curtobacterium pusillum]NUU15127.1 amidohydrolase family protein [Curtobacterium pusillum]GLK31546.1 hydroxyatrazine ethylaminohydrolase [Curtobacterium pusillum]
MLTVTGALRVLVDPRTEREGDVVVDDGSDLASVLDAEGCVVTAGLVNAHHHLLQTAFRTLPGTRGVPMADWLPTMAGAYARVGHDPELYGLAAAAGAAEGLLSGVTTIADHHLNWPADATTDDTVALAAATVDAVRGIGGRLVFVRGSARDDPDRAAASADAIAAGLLHEDAVGGVDPDGGLQVAVGPAGVHSDGEATFRALAEVAARYGLRRRTQANEQVDTAIALERYGRRPLDLLEEWGWLAPDVTIAHLCDVTDDEIARLAASGVTATHAPGCDVPMGWGIAPVARLAAAGVPVGLGTSGGGSNDAGHLLADGRLAMQVSALVGPQLPARQVLGMMTEGSAAGLGRPELGHLGAGGAGDLCVWDVSGVADAGVADPVAGLLWASPGRRPRHVVVGGRVVVRDFRLVTADERELAARLGERLARTPA